MAKFVPIKEIMAGHFVIPDFQRDYAWEKPNFELMLDDIMEACAQRKPRYVLGQLVIGDTKETRGKVVDGQQRLTSLAIVLKALGEGDCGFLDFENREASRKILAELSIPKSEEEVASLPDTSKKILGMYRLAQDYFAPMLREGGKKEGVSKEDYCNYLKRCVFFIEKRLDEGAGVQHAFEVLNTTGEPLKREDIAKAKLISDMVGLGCEKEAELFNFAWNLCCDLERDLDSIDSRVAERIADIHAASSLDGLMEAMDFVQASGESGQVSLVRVVRQVKSGVAFHNVDAKGQGAYHTGEFAALLTPYRFLDTVLEAALDKFKSISDIAKITREDDLAIASPDAALRVIKALLLYRIAVDRLVVRRKKNDERSWELKAPIGEGETKRRLILAESMMAVSGVEATRKLINAAKAAQDAALSRDEEPSPDEIIKSIEEYSINRTKNELATLDSGVGAARFAFHWLDYLLALNPPEEIKKQAEHFSFVATSSVEHLLPQTPADEREYTEEERAMLDTFGNLALVTPSINSSLSNLSPEQKVNERHRDDWRVVSLKYELMLRKTEQEGWSPAACKEHGEAMKGILAGSF